MGKAIHKNFFNKKPDLFHAEIFHNHIYFLLIFIDFLKLLVNDERNFHKLAFEFTKFDLV